jgi:hypothetical protein
MGHKMIKNANILLKQQFSFNLRLVFYYIVVIEKNNKELVI